ncbi:MAG: hypothetical protein RIC14_00215 [Filomicrobium sp.]
MSDKRKELEPAFPLAVAPEFQWASEGMSLRDWFAGQILAGNATYLANLANTGDPTRIAAVAYDVADAMLKRRDEDAPL